MMNTTGNSGHLAVCMVIRETFRASNSCTSGSVCPGRTDAVPPDHLMGGFENGLRGAIVLAQMDHPAARIILQELLEIGDIRASETIDGLIRVSDHAEGCVGFGQIQHLYTTKNSLIITDLGEGILMYPFQGMIFTHVSLPGVAIR